MKKPVLQDILRLEPLPEDNECKYKMRVSLADELSNLRSGSAAAEPHHNAAQSKSKISALPRSSLYEPKTRMTRALSKEDLNVKRLERSQSEVFNQRNLCRLSSKTDEFAYRSLLRHYRSALHNNAAPKFMKEQHIGKIFRQMGFLPLLITREDEAIVSSIRYMLTAPGRRGVSHQNLFAFLLIVCGINPTNPNILETFEESNAASALPNEPQDSPKKPLVLIEVGTMDSSERWITNQGERKQLRKIFGKLYYNKISNEQVVYKKIQKEEQPKFQPHILEYSREIAHAKRSRILREVQQYCEIRPPAQECIDLAELMMLDKKVKEEKIQLKLKEKNQLEQSGCTFHPKINKPNDSVKTESSHAGSNKDRCHKLYDRSKNAQANKNPKRPTLEEIELNQLKQCTFKPSSTKYQGTKSIKLPIRNENKLIERIREGRELRLMNSTLKTRGYPENMNWISYVNDCKKKVTKIGADPKPRHSQTRQKSSVDEPNKIRSERFPLLNMDIKLHSDTFQLEVFEGDSIESLTSKILVRHELPYEKFDRIANLIGSVIDGCNGLCVVDGIVHEVAA